MWLVYLILIIVLIYVISTFNYFKKGKEQILQQKSGIDVALTARYDTLTKMRDTVKAYMKHENTTFVEVTKVRKDMSVKELAQSEKQMQNAVSEINALAESYPDLKASVNFTNLQKAIMHNEENLQAARRAYNAVVSEYNEKIVSFPSCLITSLAHETIQTFHQIHGVHVCPKHFCYLNSIAVASYRKLLYLENWDKTITECEPDSILVHIARDVSYIMEHTPDMDNAVFREYLFDEALRSGAFRLGKWNEEEDTEWKQFYKKLPKEYETYQSGLSFQRFSSQKLMGGINPIEYLLFIRCHFGSFEAFINQLS